MRWQAGRPQLKREPLGSGLMHHSAIPTLLLVASFTLRLSGTSAQGTCLADSTRARRADSLVTRAADLLEGHIVTREIYADMRRAVELSPLTTARWRFLRQMADFLARPDTAVSLAKLAKERWPRCALSDSAVVDAAALVAKRHR